MKQPISKFMGTFWRQLLAYSLVMVFVGAVLWFHLGTLVPAFSLPELAARAEASSLHKLLANPLFLPHKLIQYSFLRLGKSSPFWMRSASAIWSLGIILVFFDIIREWYSRRIAIMGTLLLLTSAWFLHFARLGTPTIMLTTSIGLLWVGLRLRSTAAPRIRTLLASIFILGVSMYVPGLVWLIVPMLIWQRHLIWSEFTKIPKTLAAVTWALVGIGLAPLVYGLIRHPLLIRDWLMIPSRFSPGLFWSYAWHIPVWLAVRGPVLPVYWLGHVPMFDSFSVAMALLGIFVLTYYRLLDRVQAVAGIIILSLILTVLNGWLAMTIALPMFFVLVSAGLALFLQQWFTVFPRNPLARTVGITVVSFVVVLAGYYNLRHYFVAWPRNPDTRQVFNLPS